MGHGPCPTTTYIIIPPLPFSLLYPALSAGLTTTGQGVSLSLPHSLRVVYHSADLPPQNKIGIFALLEGRQLLGPTAYVRVLYAVPNCARYIYK